MPPLNSTKGILANISNPSDYFTFQYNPSNIADSKNVEWASATIPGANDSLHTFGSGGGYKVEMQLFLNALGEGSRLPNGDRNFVEKAIAFLYRFSESSSGDVLAEQFETNADTYAGSAPKGLLLSLGRLRFPGSITNTGISSLPVLPVKLSNIEVDREFFDFNDYITLRAKVNLSFIRSYGFPR